MIACVRIPYFVAALERRDRPEINGAPVVVIRSDDPRCELIALSQEASKCGVRLGMTLAQAQALCPTAQTLPARSSRYERATEETLEALSYFSPLVEVEDGFELRADARKRKQEISSVIHPSQIDAQSSAILYVDFEKVSLDEAYEITHRIHESILQLGLTAAIGMAANRFTSRALAVSLDPHEIFVIENGKEAEFLKPFPVSLLPVDGEIIRQLHLLGLESLGQVAQLPASALHNQFGKEGRTLHRLANGRDTSVVARYTPRITEKISHEFDSAVNDRAVIDNVLSSLTDALINRLQSKNETARKIEIAISTQAREIIERQLVLREPVTTGQSLLRSLKELFDSIQVSGPITDLEIILSGITSIVGRQMSLFDREPVSQVRLREVIRDLVIRYGDDSIYMFKLINQSARLPKRRFIVQKVKDSDLFVA